MSPPTTHSPNHTPFSSSSSHRLSSAPASSNRSRKSSSAHPTTSNGTPPRTHISSPAPIQIPLSNYGSHIVRRFPREGSYPPSSLNPAFASDPGKLPPAGTEERSTRRRSRSRNLDPPRSTRRASYTSAVLRGLVGDLVPNKNTEGQQWAPSTHDGKLVTQDSIRDNDLFLGMLS